MPEDLIRELVEKGMVRFGTFTLTSGKKSPYYIDLRRMYAYPELSRSVALKLIRLAESLRIRFEVVVGIATAGVPLATYIACLSSKPLAYVRKEAKMHGLSRLVEGDVAGREVLLVDDVATTGSSLLHGVRAIRECGGRVSHALVVIDREEGAEEALKNANVSLHSLVKARDVVSYAIAKNLVPREQLAEVMRYLGIEV